MYLDKLTEKDYLAAVALMCLKYSLNVASDKCAESAEAPPAKKLKHDEPMEVTEQAAGPSGKPKPCNRLQLVLKERLRDLNNNNKSKNWTIDGFQLVQETPLYLKINWTRCEIRTIDSQRAP
ncbi:uncharacterized protein [Choristoneura fumiferana]|uniref:uncharacterized protein n=1 Tax=Choristoneura fumiferana TaxID=7141 RepID=UPI003D15E956